MLLESGIHVNKGVNMQSLSSDLINLISDEAMVKITGHKQADKQCKQLLECGIGYTKDKDGYPTLSWESYHRQTSARKDAVQEVWAPRLDQI
jgi:hypothetical protein